MATQVTSDMLAAGAAVANIGTGGITKNELANPLTQGTAQNSTSGTSVNFTGIPSWVKRITVMLNGVSTTSTGVPSLRLGTSSSVENTGYTSSVNLVATSAVSGQASATSGFELVTTGIAASLYSGNIVLTNITANTWIISGSLGVPLAGYNYLCAGNKTLAGVLTQLQLTTTGGTDTFDAGSINIMYE